MATPRSTDFDAAARASRARRLPFVAAPAERILVPARFAGVRLDRALDELVPSRTRAQLQKLVRRGCVELDGRALRRSNVFLRGGETLRIRGAAAPALDWLHVESAFAVVAKPPGLLVHPTDRDATTSVAQLAVARFGPLPSAGEARPGIVHRLDRETSGVLVLARTDAALAELRDQFRARTVAKRYRALVHGAPRADRFEVDRPLAPVPGDRERLRVDPGGRAAHSAFRVLRRWRDFALVEARPTTGRRHQLRVHLAHSGHPVVGDALYRPPRGVARVRALGHHALHAEALAFAHPETGRRVEFRAPPPETFASFCKRLERGAG